MSDRFIRTEILLGEDAMKKLHNARVAVFGVGGVGGYTVEALARSGVGEIDVIDNDTVAESNINRQIIANTDTVGRDKVEVIKERILSINPECEVNAHKTFYLPEIADEFDFGAYDYVVDAIDTVTAKISLVMKCKEANTPIISSMGTGNKLNPCMLEVTDIYKTSVCPLARVMRKELKDRGVKALKVVYSKEEPIKPKSIDGEEQAYGKRATPGSTAFVPPVAGLIIASEVKKDLIK